MGCFTSIWEATLGCFSTSPGHDLCVKDENAFTKWGYLLHTWYKYWAWKITLAKQHFCSRYKIVALSLSFLVIFLKSIEQWPDATPPTSEVLKTQGEDYMVMTHWLDLSEANAISLKVTFQKPPKDQLLTQVPSKIYMSDMHMSWAGLRVDLINFCLSYYNMRMIQSLYRYLIMH